MKLTIIPVDNLVMVDSIVHAPLDLSTCNIPFEVHALQWFGEKGWVEFIEPVDPFGQKQPNEMIEALPAWANACVTVWNAWTPPAPPEVTPAKDQPTTGLQNA